MKKILILTCSTGEGHNSAAKAIETALHKRHVSCVIRDPVSFQSEKAEKLVSGLYNQTIRRTPHVFGAVYQLGNLYSQARLPSPVYWANARYAPALRRYILTEGFDAVICTHLYGMEAMTAIRRQWGLSIPCYGVLTDYVCIPFTDETDLTGFFVPTKDTAEFMIRRGIPREKLHVTGIPVDEKFRRLPGRESARAVLNLPLQEHIYLIMTGGVGCENMETLCRRMLEKMEENELLVVLTGRNDTLRARLDAMQDSRCRTVPFTKQVELYLAACDVLLSKPGGLSTTEAAVAGTPMVHIHAIPGCETYNARYFAQHSMALHAENNAQAVADALKLCRDPRKAEAMRSLQHRFIRPDAADTIAEEVLRSCTATVRFCG